MMPLGLVWKLCKGKPQNRTIYHWCLFLLTCLWLEIPAFLDWLLVQPLGEKQQLPDWPHYGLSQPSQRLRSWFGDGMGWDGMGGGWLPHKKWNRTTRNIANFAGGKCGLRIFGKSLGCLWPPTIRGLTWGTSTLSPKLPWVSTTLGSHRRSFRPTYIWPIYTKSHRFVRSCRCIFSFDFLKLLSC